MVYLLEVMLLPLRCAHHSLLIIAPYLTASEELDFLFKTVGYI